MISILPKYSVSQIMGYLKGKSSLMIFDRQQEYIKKQLQENKDIKIIPLKGWPEKAMQLADLFSSPLGVLSVLCPYRA